MLMETQDKSKITFTEEQADEVRRRLAEPAPKTIHLPSSSASAYVTVMAYESSFT